MQQLYTDTPISLLNLGSSPPLRHRYPQDDHSIHSWKRKLLNEKSMPSKSKGAWLKFPVRAIEQFIRKMNAFHTPILCSHSIIHLNIYSNVCFYIVVFGMTLVWNISANAPKKGCPRALHKTEIPFSWLTGFLLSCGHMCLLTSYCKRQMPC